MLGPLEVLAEERQVALGGIKQRGTLGFLLLNANRVAATSQLMKALWPVETPMSARKILQNAVWGLRSLLTPSIHDVREPELLTQAPGYMLRVDPETVDLYRFQRMVAAGRVGLASGNAEQASAVLRDALALWRGPALADLVEAGAAWPELTAVQNARLDALEDYFDAELGCGRHHEILRELETTVETEPLRERACGQLMRTLYLCGRQADALSVYARVRTQLIDELGLEPGRKLQVLQHSILTHDPSLGSTGPVLPDTRERIEALPVSRPEPEPEPVLAGEPEPVENSDATERQPVSVIVVRTQLSPQGSEVAPEDVDEAFECMSTTIREEAEARGGAVVASFGSISMVVFGPADASDTAVRAVKSAIAIRERLRVSSMLAARTTPVVRGLAVHVAVATGKARVRYQNGETDVPAVVNGALLDQCQAMLNDVPDDEILVCDSTRLSTQSVVNYHSMTDARTGWQVGEPWPEYLGYQDVVPLVDRDSELDLLRGVLNRAIHRNRCHMVTVIGDPGIGKTRLVREFAKRYGGPQGVARFLIGRAPLGPGGSPLAVQADILAGYCGVKPGDDRSAVREKVQAALQQLVLDDGEVQWLMSGLVPLAELAAAGDDRRVASSGDAADTLQMWQRFLALVAKDTPLVVVVEDLHRCDRTIRQWVRQLAQPTQQGVPMMIVATALPELLGLNPDWGSGAQSVTIKLEPLSDDAIDKLAESLTDMMDSELERLVSGYCGNQYGEVGPVADNRREYLRLLLGHGAKQTAGEDESRVPAPRR
ncbi:BTAD domain-containing putative transcriptional regulator [Amycolatopsis umgeniensis]|uniref:DNA-binding SARP family transcriptional activator n=1 Tax=Amycolatopsis umgeniensis TaxID=336628 RepID=A0A841BEU2_9PSEU|nr:BTAD domain-containing putative transcriptional regulator [Amycolatopsis umgeniensis]MBB5857520.1 DNA-binding SARP family transcriptional activator [Amycolatopsis umgeniensis]